MRANPRHGRCCWRRSRVTVCCAPRVCSQRSLLKPAFDSDIPMCNLGFTLLFLVSELFGFPMASSREMASRPSAFPRGLGDIGLTPHTSSVGAGNHDAQSARETFPAPLDLGAPGDRPVGFGGTEVAAGPGDRLVLA